MYKYYTGSTGDTLEFYTKELYIEKYTEDNQELFYVLKRKIPEHSELRSLKLQTFCNGKYVYLLFCKGFLNTKKIIGYAILYHYEELSEELKDNIECYHVPSELFADRYNVLISDFMIDRQYRRFKLGTSFFEILVDTYYKLTQFVLFADGDGLYFWNKVGFHEVNVKKYKNIMTKLLISKLRVELNFGFLLYSKISNEVNNERFKFNGK